MSNDILPTHTCFDDTTEIIANQLKTDPRRLRDLQLIHAICLLPTTDKPYAHAWVEQGDEAFFCGILNGQKVIVTVVKEEYRKGLRIQQSTKYNFTEVLKYNAQHNSSGPWQPEYKALCRKNS